MSFISKLAYKIKRLFGLSKVETEAPEPAKKAKEPTNIGTQGRIDADMVILRDHDRMILSIDYDFKDILGWIEWDISGNRLDLVQKSGAVADLGSIIPTEDAADFRALNKVFVITRYNHEKIMHNLNLVIRD